ncbi:hypothetical protein [Acidithiobacillus sp. AMEEHan]|uniref:hypothetical protein n=1 Tax=Acidithiobacillus sp. AMEEHan TaxID=2994951 RepID=UPI0027E540FD|nr:hypothetical protein [Acidithiobacillus sp. AMEEHan]
MILVAILYFFVALAASLGASVIAPRERALRGWLPAWLLFLLLSVFLPFLGAVLAVSYAIALRSVRHRIHVAAVEPILVPAPARDLRLRISVASEGAVAGRLRGSRNLGQRVEALSQIVSSRFAEQTRLLRSALRDEAEEIRLLAYAALDQREQENTELLLDLQQDIEHSSSPRLRQRLQEYLAWLRWNIDHTDSRELADPLLRKEEAKPELGFDDQAVEPAPAMLRGLRALEIGAAGQALELFRQAEQANVAPSVLAPYRAAALYLQRDIQGLQSVYADHPEMALSPRYAASYRFWIGQK